MVLLVEGVVTGTTARDVLGVEEVVVVVVGRTTRGELLDELVAVVEGVVTRAGDVDTGAGVGVCEVGSRVGVLLAGVVFVAVGVVNIAVGLNLGFSCFRPRSPSAGGLSA